MSRYIDRAELFNRLSDVKTLAAAMVVIQDMPAAEIKNVPDTNVGDMISRQAAIAYAISGKTREIDGEKWIRVSEVRESIKTLPSAERHGHWTENETSYADPPTKQTCNCSICGKASTRPLGDWCRWCGAKMDEVEE